MRREEADPLTGGGDAMRREDPGLLTGRTRFTGDLSPRGTLELVFVRSRLAHGEIRALELGAARALPGVAGVYGPDELRRMGGRPMPCSWLTEGQQMTAIPLLAETAVHYTGQPLAAVLAEDLYVAEDAAALVEATIAALPAVVDVESALAPGAPVLHPDWGSNLVAEVEVGGGDVEGEMARSEVRINTRLSFQRQAPAPMEGRGAVAEPDPESGRVTAWLSTQGAHHARGAIAAACGWSDDRLRVICPAVGGSFGLKEYAYPEEAVVCLLAASTGRPVRWLEDRRENLIGGCHARESIIDLELGADADGHVSAVAGTWLWDVGGHPSSHGLGPPRFGAALLTGPYRIDACRILVRGVVTNKTPIGGYRGYGSPQAHLAMERAMDALAGSLGISTDEIRRRNLLSAHELPRSVPSGITLDSGGYLEAYEEMLVAVGEAAEETEPGEGGRVGAGVTPYVMISALGPSKGAVGSGLDHGSYETAHVRMHHDGTTVVHVGTSAQGQGHATLLAGVAAQTLGVLEDQVRVVSGDTDLTPFSPVSAVGSRTAAVVATAVRAACAPLADKLSRQAAHRLACEPEEVVLSGGEARAVAGMVAVAELAFQILGGLEVADGLEPGLDSVATVDPPAMALTYGVHGAVVEVDPVIGTVTVRRYLALDDCGPRLRPATVEGQLRGGILQGIGSALLEELRYDADGTPLSTGFGDYLLPIATTAPPIEFRVRETPSPALPGGAKGVGEAGVIGPPAAIAQAVDHALTRHADALTRLPLTPKRVIALCREVSAR
jgi:carbon-monoxide dehydrogenase large subunit